MEATIVGDLHGNLKLYQKIRENTKGLIILVGDLLDSFIFSRADQLALLEQVLNDIESGKVECLFGNHELSYLIPSMHCAGYSAPFDVQLMPLKPRMWRLMKPYILDKENKVLISHAGLSMNIFNELPTMDELEELLMKWWRDPEHSDQIFWAGHARFGPHTCGGIFWCDWNLEFLPIPGLTQIFGHTPVPHIMDHQGNWDIDCVERDENQVAIKLSGKYIEIVHYEKVSSKTPGGSESTTGTVGEEKPRGTVKTFGPAQTKGSKRKSKARKKD